MFNYSGRAVLTALVGIVLLGPNAAAEPAARGQTATKPTGSLADQYLSRSEQELAMIVGRSMWCNVKRSEVRQVMLMAETYANPPIAKKSENGIQVFRIL